MFVYAQIAKGRGWEDWLVFIRSDSMAPIVVAYSLHRDAKPPKTWHLANDPIAEAPPITPNVSRRLREAAEAGIERAFYRRDSEHRPPNCSADVHDMRQLLEHFGTEYLGRINSPSAHAPDEAIGELSREVERLRNLLCKAGVDPDPLAE